MSIITNRLTAVAKRKKRQESVMHFLASLVKIIIFNSNFFGESSFKQHNQIKGDSHEKSNFN